MKKISIDYLIISLLLLISIQVPFEHGTANAGDEAERIKIEEIGKLELIPFKTGEPPNELWGYRDSSGNTVITPRFDHAGPFSGGLAPVWLKCDTKEDEQPKRLWTYINRQGNYLSPPRFEAAGEFQGGKALVLHGGDFVFISMKGEILEKLGTSKKPPALPKPSEGANRLERYGDQLRATTPEYQLMADPSNGESSLTLYVRALNHGVMAIRKVGWEGQGYILSIPGIGFEEGVSLVKQILGREKYTDVTSKEIFPGETVFEIEEPEFVAEFIRIRPCGEGVVEIEHTIWAS